MLTRIGERVPVRSLVVLFMILGSAAAAAAPAGDARLAASRDIAMTMQAQLKAELMAAMAAVGPAAAIGVCRTRAPAIAAQAGNTAGVRVSRTALRLRNPANAPDAASRAVLVQFAQRLRAGAAPESLEHFAPAPGGSARFMKAIVIQPPCLACHGDDIAGPVRQALRELYPADAATGFAVGELRGAVVVEWPAGAAEAP